MKRFYMTLATIAAFSMGTVFAQTDMVETDIEAFININELGEAYDLDCTSSDSFQVNIAFVNNGPEDILLSNFSQELYLGFIDATSNYDLTTGGSIWIQPVEQDWMVGEALSLSYMVHVDELVNIVDINAEEFATADVMTNGNPYGYFVLNWGLGFLGDSWISLVDEDLDPENDLSIAPFNYICESSSIAAVKERTQLKVYPNPTENVLNFTHEFTSNSNAIVNVTDVTGRVVMTQDFGTATIGVQDYSVNVSELTSGTYFIEFITDNGRGVSKFTKK